MQCTLTQLHQTWSGTIVGYRVIQISGDDRVKYLQGQVTCNLETLSVNQACLGAHCDFKGKTWAVFILAKLEDKLFLIAPSSAALASMAELKKYGVFSKVEIEDVSTQFQFTAAKDPSNENSKPTWSVSESDSAVTLYLPGEVALTLSSESATQNVTALFDATLIQQGIAFVADETINEYVPQMFNMQCIPNAIDFKKGCYMGQEVVARTKYLGKNKRAGFIIHSNQSIELKQGAVLEYAIGENWRRAGAVLNHSQFRDKTYTMAVLPNDLAHDTVLRLKDKPDVTFSIEALPYALEE